MMDFTQDMKIGVEHIDAQHGELVEFLCKSIKLCAVIPDKADINAALDFLGTYVVSHFEDEEKLQIECNYPDYEEHKKLHEDFIKTFKVLKMTYMEGNTSRTEFSQILAKKVATWVVTHVKQEDIKFGKYYNEYLKNAATTVMITEALKDNFISRMN